MQMHAAEKHEQRGFTFGARMEHRHVQKFNKFQSRLGTFIEKHRLQLLEKWLCTGVGYRCVEGSGLI